MKVLKRPSRVLLLFSLPFIFSACFYVRVVEDVKNPESYFTKAYKRIERIHERYPNRNGHSSEINVLVYEKSNGKLIKVTAPIWFVNTCMDIGVQAGEKEGEFDFEKKYDFDWRGLKDFKKIGPGLLVEVVDEDNKILIWIE